jgi:hypothetical protein
MFHCDSSIGLGMIARMTQPRKQCAYCSNYGVTKEHYWGRWSAKYIPRQAGDTNDHIVTRVTSVAERQVAAVAKKGRGLRQGSIQSQQLRVVCGQCNNGWMKQTNLAAEPMLARLAKKEKFPTGRKDQNALASWIAMFSMTYEFADHWSLATPQSEREHLREHGLPPSNWAVWIGAYGEGRWTNQLNHKGAYIKPSDQGRSPEFDVRIAPNMNTQMTVFTFGSLLIAAFSTRVSDCLDIDSFTKMTGLRRIWPTPLGPGTRSLRTFNDTEVDYIAHWINEEFLADVTED